MAVHPRAIELDQAAEKYLECFRTNSSWQFGRNQRAWVSYQEREGSSFHNYLVHHSLSGLDGHLLPLRS
jgi:hypothetical protein